MDTQTFLNNAKALVMITNDQWTKGFVTSLIEQVTSGRTLSEKQINIFNAKLDAIFNPPAPIEIDQELVTQIDALKSRTKSKWLLNFCDSILTQMKSGKALSEKQKSVFKAKYDWLVLKIKPTKVEPEWEDFIDQND
jgi:hypothetical protein